MTKICIFDTFGFNRCRCRNYESPLEIFKPKKVSIVFWQYLSHFTCSRVHSCCVEIRIARHVALRRIASCRVMSRYVALCHVMSRHVMSRHVTSCHVIMPRDVPHVTSWHVTSCHITSRHVMSRHVIMPRDVPHVTSCHVTSCHVMSHLAPSCHVMSYHVTSYHVESRGTVTRPTLHCQLTSSTRNHFKLSMTVFVGCPEGCRYNTASAVYDLVFPIFWFNWRQYLILYWFCKASEANLFLFVN